MPSPTAFVGLGAIGLPMASSIARAGLPLIGVEPSPAGRDRAASAGIDVVEDLAEIGDAEIVVVMVATAAQLASVVDRAIETAVAADRVWLIMSTVGPEAVTAAARTLVAAGGRVIDAPVSGGIPRASTGDLLLFAAGATADLAAAEPVLAALGTARIVGAEVGEGQAMKVINQHLCAVHIAAAAEALALAERLGLDPGFVLEVVEPGAASSFMLRDRGPRMLESPDAPVLSQIGIFVKDTGLVAAAAEEAGFELPLLAAARDRFLSAERLGLRTHDDSSVIETYRTPGGAS